MSLRPLLRIAAEDERFRVLATSVVSGDGASVRASASIRPYLLAALLDDPDALAGRPALVVATDDIAARDLARDLAAYLAPRRVHHYPSRGLGYASNLTPAPHLVGLRIAALDALMGWIDAGDPPVVVASALALAEAIPDASLRPAGFSISHGEEIDLGDVTELLVDLGYERTDQVEERGQFAVRGGIPEATSIVLAAGDEVPAALAEHWEDVTTAMHDEDARRLYVEVSRPLAERGALSFHGVGDVENGAGAVFRSQATASTARSIAEAQSQLEREVRSGYVVAVAFERRGEAERAQYNLDRVGARFLDGAAPTEPGAYLGEGELTEGFVSPDLHLAVYPFRRLVHRRRAAAPAPARGRLTSAFDLRVGDYVVHEDHGIARFAGFETKTVADVTRDYLELSYRGDDRVFAPTDQLAKITRYVGAGDGAPQLSALGSKRWEGVKARARRAARELAGELLNLYAERQARSGHAFPPDGEWQLELERAFPYRETPDQLEAIEAIKADMESARPMDRLICGDVGYGKTEVALRAAHKAAVEGKQMMMLVPTTILAQQHFGTFRERFAETPFNVEMVSRLRRAAVPSGHTSAPTTRISSAGRSCARRSAAARSSSSTTGSRRCTKRPSGSGRSVRGSASPRPTGRWTSSSSRRRCSPSSVAST